MVGALTVILEAHNSFFSCQISSFNVTSIGYTHSSFGAYILAKYFQDSFSSTFVIISFIIADTSFKPGVAKTSNSKAHSVSTSSGVTLTFVREIVFLSTLIFTSFEVQVSFPSASNNFATNTFSHSCKFVTSFSNIHSLFVIIIVSQTQFINNFI
ncbi:MAG: hypothetical protein LBQ24_02970 [Candidatus Peribacteria bacterium]|jgi:hypothetical protein|nr:hypothetical protein [Candidatus Peribacteria bacterium]